MECPAWVSPGPSLQALPAVGQRLWFLWSVAEAGAPECQEWLCSCLWASASRSCGSFACICEIRPVSIVHSCLLLSSFTVTTHLSVPLQPGKHFTFKLAGAGGARSWARLLPAPTVPPAGHTWYNCSWEVSSGFSALVWGWSHQAPAVLGTLRLSGIHV